MNFVCQTSVYVNFHARTEIYGSVFEPNLKPASVKDKPIRSFFISLKSDYLLKLNHPTYVSSNGLHGLAHHH
jgi:hypothetical protein